MLGRSLETFLILARRRKLADAVCTHWILCNFLLNVIHLSQKNFLVHEVHLIYISSFIKRYQ